MKRIAIIGGGIGGLAAAYRLREHAVRRGEMVHLTVLEAGRRWGGVIRSSQQQGFTLEHGPDSIIRSKPAALQLIKDLGLEDQLQPTRESARRSLIARGRRLLPVPEGLYLMAPGKLLPFLRSPLLSWPGKLRMALDLVLPRRDPHASEESLAEFVRRRLGQEALDRIAQPLVSGIYTADPEQLSLASTMPLFPQLEQEHRSLILAMRRRARDQDVASASGPRYGLFVSLRGGLQRLTDRLVEALADADLRLGAPVSAVVRNGEKLTVALAEDYLDFDQVVVATPAHHAATLCKPLDQVLSYLLVTIPYAGVATINLGFRREQCPELPDAAGFVVPAVEGRALIACTIASAKYADRAPEDGVLLRAFVGGALGEAMLGHDDPTLVAMVMEDLRDLLGVRGEPYLSTVDRWPKAMAQYVLGHADRVKSIRLRERLLPGVALVGNGYEGVGIPDIIAQADQAAARLSGIETTMPPPVRDAASRATTA
jgi:oxygen-dependent protoporphyrinogen oxidase